MNDNSYERLRALNPAVVDVAKEVAAKAVAAMPRDLQPAEEPAHVYSAIAAGADDTECAP